MKYPKIQFINNSLFITKNHTCLVKLSFLLNIYNQCYIFEDLPNFTIPLTEKIIVMPDDGGLTLTVEVSGDHRPFVLWYKDGFPADKPYFQISELVLSNNNMSRKIRSTLKLKDGTGNHTFSAKAWYGNTGPRIASLALVAFFCKYSKITYICRYLKYMLSCFVTVCIFCILQVFELVFENIFSLSSWPRKYNNCFR